MNMVNIVMDIVVNKVATNLRITQMLATMMGTAHDDLHCPWYRSSLEETQLPQLQTSEDSPAAAAPRWSSCPPHLSGSPELVPRARSLRPGGWIMGTSVVNLGMLVASPWLIQWLGMIHLMADYSIDTSG